MKIVNILKIIIGFLAFILAIIGILIPVWPTTPFVILAIWCFSSMPKLKNKLLSISFFKEYYESYTLGKPICRRTTASSLVFLWIMLVISIIFTKNIWTSFILVLVGTAVTIHILYISRGRKNKKIISRRNTDES